MQCSGQACYLWRLLFAYVEAQRLVGLLHAALACGQAMIGLLSVPHTLCSTAHLIHYEVSCSLPVVRMVFANCKCPLQCKCRPADAPLLVPTGLCMPDLIPQCQRCFIQAAGNRRGKVAAEQGTKDSLSSVLLPSCCRAAGGKRKRSSTGCQTRTCSTRAWTRTTCWGVRCTARHTCTQPQPGVRSAAIIHM